MANVAAEKIVKKVLQRDIRTLAKIITEIESETELGNETADLLFTHSGKAKVIGVTGAPGAGKSTLVDSLAAELVRNKNRVAILAVDPSSPFSGGAVLGDRVRMVQAAGMGEVYIRSMASRGSLGGLAPRTMDVVFALDAAGYDYIIIETVGVGQGEVEIMRVADTIMVVLVPGTGDGVQAMKAGILEIADVFVINKSDYSGADLVEKDLKTLISLGIREGWEPVVIRTIATKNEGIIEGYAAIQEHQKWLEKSHKGNIHKRVLFEDLFRTELSKYITAAKEQELKSSGQWEQCIEKIVQRKSSPRKLIMEVCPN